MHLSSARWFFGLFVGLLPSVASAATLPAGFTETPIAAINNPTAMALVNNQFNADGSLNMARQYPKNAGFGAATSARTLRNIQLQLRFQF